MTVIFPEEIKKETISSFGFNHDDVLESDFEKSLRNEKLFRAMILGNTYKQKVKIIFETTEGIKSVETTIWATTDQNILLKGGINLPISCIREIRLAA